LELASSQNGTSGESARFQLFDSGVSQALLDSLALNQPQNTCVECILARIGASSFRKMLK